MHTHTAIGDAPKVFPYWQLAVLAICRFSEPIAFNSILAYSYPMTIELHGGDDSDASFYSALLISAYAVAEAATSVFWGSLSDRYGRKPVVLIGLAGVALSCLIFGFAPSYPVALLARLVGGALNGNVSVMQTMVAEMVKHPEHEPLAYAVQPFVWTLGGIIGSVLGGFLAQPAHFYPEYFAADGIFGRWPYLLPNLMSVLVIVLAIIQGCLFLEETNPRAKKLSSSFYSSSTKLALPTETTPLLLAGEDEDLSKKGSATVCISEVASDSDTEVGSVIFNGADGEETYTGPVWTKTIVMLIVSLVLLAYHQMAAGALFPIHLLDDPAYSPEEEVEADLFSPGDGLDASIPGRLDLIGGFGYSLHDVSVFLMLNGFASLVIQGLIFPIFLAAVGIRRSFLITVALYPIAYLLMPFLSAAPSTALRDAGILGSLVLQAFFCIISVPAGMILLKDATPSPLVLGRVNGLAMSACCAARTFSPPIAGLLYSSGGSAVAWLSCALVAVVGAVQLFWVPVVVPGGGAKVIDEDDEDFVHA